MLHCVALNPPRQRQISQTTFRSTLHGYPTSYQLHRCHSLAKILPRIEVYLSDLLSNTQEILDNLLVPWIYDQKVQYCTNAPKKHSEHMRLALLTDGPANIAGAFSRFPGTPVGVICWKFNRSWSDRGPWKRKRALEDSPIGRICSAEGLQFAELHKNQSDVLASLLRRWSIELIITSRCPLVPPSILSTLPYGGINLHPSLLPAYRGIMPLFWQAIDCVENTGCTVHRLSADVDRGHILAQSHARRPDGATMDELAELTEQTLGIPLLHQVLAEFHEGRMTGHPQPEKSPTRYATMVRQNNLESLVDVESLDAQAIWNAARFLGFCPPAIARIAGWRSLLKWKPVSWSIDKKQDLNSPNKEVDDHQIFRPSGSIKLEPEFDMRHMIRTLMNRA